MLHRPIEITALIRHVDYLRVDLRPSEIRRRPLVGIFSSYSHHLSGTARCPASYAFIVLRERPTWHLSLGRVDES